MTPAEWVLVACLVGGVPPLVLWDYRILQREVAAGRDGARIRAYVRSIVGSWAVAAAALVLWWQRGGGVEGVGLGLPSDRGDLVVLALGVALGALMVADLRRILRSDGARADARRQLEPLASLLPHDRRELTAFRAVAVTAGITEEVVYRGWLLALWIPLMGAWAAVPAAALLFGVAHLYQGAVGVARSGAFGLVAGALFAVTGNLWGLIVAHVVVDLMGGELAWRILGAGSHGVPEGASGAYRTGGFDDTSTPQPPAP